MSELEPIQEIVAPIGEENAMDQRIVPFMDDECADYLDGRLAEIRLRR